MSLNVSLDNLQSKIAAVADQNENTSDISTADYSLRRSYINMSQREWSETYDWQALYKENHSLISTNTANSSVALPGDFRKLAAEPRITFDGATTEDFPEIRAQEVKNFDDASARYVYVLGNQADNYTMRIHLGEDKALSSGASIKLPYYASPASLVSPADIAMVPNPEYLVQRTLAYIWEGQQDPRFQQAKAEADKILQKLLEFEVTHGESYYDRVNTVERNEFSNFRWGKS